MGCKKCAEEVCGCSTMNAEDSPTPTWNAPSIFPVTAMQVVIGASHGSTMDWSRIFNVNVRGSTEDLGYLTAGLEDEVKDRVSKWNKTWDAESLNAETNDTCDTCQKDKPIVAHVEFDGPFLSALCKECYAEHLEMGGKPNVYDAEAVGTPSPTFNEDITGQDGPSADPTNSNFSAETQTFEAMRRLAPSSKDVETARRHLKSKYGEVIYDRYLVNQAGSSNKFYYTSITHKDGKYYAMGAHGRIGSLGGLFNIKGGKADKYATCPSEGDAFGYVKTKEAQKVNKKGDKAYKDYTLQMAENSLEEIEGPTAEATSGGLHSPSSFDMTWEDGSGQSSASIPPNEIAWAEGKDENAVVKAAKTPIGAVFVGTALALLGYSFITGGNLLKDLSAGAKSAVSSAAENRKTGCRTCKDSFNAGKYGGGQTPQPFSDPVSCRANGCNWSRGKCNCQSHSAKQRGGPRREEQTFDSEYSVGQINPVEVEGQTDVHGAEQVFTGPSVIPQYSNRPSLKMW